MSMITKIRLAVLYLMIGICILEVVAYFFNIIYKIVKVKENKEGCIKQLKEDIKSEGIIIPIFYRVYRFLRMDFFNKKYIHEIDLIFHTVMIASIPILEFNNLPNNEMLAKILITTVAIRLIYLHIHQMNVLFFDRLSKIKIEKNNISSISRIVLISVINGIEIYITYLMLYNLRIVFNIILYMATISTIILFLASVSQLFNFNRK